MTTLVLEPQRTIVVCPDCGQRYDPAGLDPSSHRRPEYADCPVVRTQSTAV